MFANRKAYQLLVLAGIVVLGGSWFYFDLHTEKKTMTEPKVLSPECEIATVGGGCFWCLEAVFEQIQGVVRVESGYTGGSVKNPTYRQVCGGATDHAEVVQIAFDPKVITYREILQIFYVMHDPTTLNQQGADVGTQYRSAIFYHSPQQKETATALIAELNSEKLWDRPIVTQVAPLETFYRAEENHQGYYRANSGDRYCRAVVAPKLTKLRKLFLAKLKTP